ncbi:MAG: hypothetical protein JKP98_12500 [Rhodobacteraceae bacterium]|jgi:hypothetical protein|nr:hypothetical protein [Alphaproteobacteria bacterium]MBL4557601.1 hypothetical protein [Paracoccaceae bacterium]
MPEDIYDVSKYVGTAEGCEKGLSRLDARNIEIGKEIQSLKDEQGRLTEATVVIERALAFHNQSAEKLSPTQEYLISQNKQRLEKSQKVKAARKVLEEHGLEDVLEESKQAKAEGIKAGAADAIAKAEELKGQKAPKAPKAKKVQEDKKGEDGAQ